MPSNFTENYRLSQWERSDKVLMEDFNADNAKIDAALKVQADAHAALAARSGNCRIWTITYTGNGLCGSDNPTTITFPKKPLLAVIEIGNRFAWIPSQDGWFYVSDNKMNHFSWSGTTASWWQDPYGTTTENAASIQLNTKNQSYRVIALFAADQ